jgi:sugar phosphate isomerase/epimerase
VTRRNFLPAVGLPLLAAKEASIKLSVGTYGMQTLEVDRALAEIRTIGYQGAELCLMAGWPSEPAKLDSAARRRIREQQLPIPSLIENFSLLVSDADHARTLDRIRIAAALGHDVSPRQLPLLQTVLGGKPNEWDQVKSKMASRLADWGRVAHDNGLKLAVKSHIGSASDTPEKLIWLLDQVKNPALTGIYDYSHFQLLGLDLEKSLQTLLPHASFLTVKDGRMADGKPQFLLPGEGAIDYKKYFRILKANRFKGWMLVEISRQLQTMPGYDPIAAARKSYHFLSPLLH